MIAVVVTSPAALVAAGGALVLAGLCLGIRISAREHARLAYDLVQIRELHRRQWVELDRLHGVRSLPVPPLVRPMGVPDPDALRSPAAEQASAHQASSLAATPLRESPQ